MMQGGVIRVNVCWDTYSMCQAVDVNNEQDRAYVLALWYTGRDGFVF